MTAFSIQIHYRTGDSFGNKDVTTEVGSWKNLEAVKECLRRIKAHYRAYEEESDWNQPKKFDESKFEKEPWFFNGEWRDMWKYFVVLVDDEFNPIERSAFWCGYFESLYEAKVIVEQAEDDDLVFRP